jgi:NTE family protein
MKNKKFTDFSKMHLPINGLFSLDSLKDTLKEGIDVEDLKDLKIPFYACVSNLHTGKVEYLNCGPLYKIIQASSSIPIVFSPVEINKQVYVDGGLMDNLPVRPLVRQCEKIIGVNIFPDKETEKIDNLLKVATRIFQISLNSNIKYNKSKCHLYIEPEAISKYHMLETKFNEQIFEIGYKFCKNVKLKQLM